MNIIAQLEAEQVAKVVAQRSVPDFGAGDTVVVNVKVKEGDRTRVQAYEGVVIGRSGGGLNENFTVRKLSYGEGVERIFPVYSPITSRAAPANPRVSLKISAGMMHHRLKLLWPKQPLLLMMCH
jgi:ribosomal protein L19